MMDDLMAAALTVFVLTRDLRSTLNRVYLLWGMSIVVWNTGTFFMFHTQSAQTAEFWGRFLHVGVIFLPVSLLHISMLTARVARSAVSLGCVVV